MESVDSNKKNSEKVSSLYLRDRWNIQPKWKSKINENYITDDYFDDWVTHLPYQPFDLRKSKDEMFYEFYNRMMSSEIGNWEDLSKTILKSYYLQKPEDAKQYCDVKRLRVANPMGLIADFLNKYLSASENSCNGNTTSMDAYAKFITQKLEKIFGDVIFFNSDSKHLTSLKDRVQSKLKANGYEFGSSLNPQILKIADKKSGKHPPDNEEVLKYQNLLMQEYKNAVEKYLQNPQKYLTQEWSGATFDKFWGTVRDFCENCEQRFTAQSKQNPQIVALENQVHEFFEKKLEVLRTKYTRDGVMGRYGAKLSASLQKYTAGKATERDMQTLLEFENRMYILEKALSVRDENGNFPLNALVVLPMPIPVARDIMFQFIRSGFCEADKTARLYNIRSMLNPLVAGQLRNEYLVIENPNFLLSKFKLKCTYFDKNTQTQKETDFSSDEKFQQLKEQTTRIVQQYNLPHYAICYNLIAYNLVRGRQPINLGNCGLTENLPTTTSSNLGKGKE